jgi:hypothetical protein
MHLSVSDPAVIPALVAALRAAECEAEPCGPRGVDVLFPWLRDGADARQAAIELRFFARTWEALYPGVEVRLAGPR